MKRRFTLVGLGLATLLLLPSCHREEKVTHLDHQDYPALAEERRLTVCSSNLYEEKKYYYDICNNNKVRDTSNSWRDVFDTSLFVRYSAHELTTEEIIGIEDLFSDAVKSFHVLFDSNYSYSDSAGDLFENIHTINQSYGSEKTIEVMPWIFEILQQARTLTVLSKGRFNIFVGEISSFWDEVIATAQDGLVPSDLVDPSEYPAGSPAALLYERALSSTPDLSGEKATYEEFDKILTLSSENGRYYVNFNKYGDIDKMSITLGAIGKGYAIEKAKQILRSNGYERGIIYGGGSSIVSLGDSYRDDSWRISVTNPLVRSETVGTYRMPGQSSFSTSGDQERGYVFTLSDGTTVRRHHVIDPRLGHSSNIYRTVALYAHDIDAGIADAVSTTLMNTALFEGPKSFVSAVLQAYGQSEEAALEFALFEETGERSMTVYLTEGFKKHLTLSGGSTAVRLQVL